MTLAVAWRRQLQRATVSLERTLRQTVLERFCQILDRQPHAPAWAARLLAAIEERIQERRIAMPESPGDLDRALRALSDTIARRPNPFVFAGRMALWLIPALVAGAAILFSLYPAPRAMLFTTLLVVGVLVGAALWLLAGVQAAHRRVIKARDEAIDTVIGRQEVILSTNAIDYLADLVGVLSEELGRAHTNLERYTATLGTTEADLAGRLDQDLPDTPPLAPVVTLRAEIERLFTLLAIDEERWLVDALTEERLAGFSDEQLDRQGWLQELLAWSERRIKLGEASGKPSYGDLWRIRREVRGEAMVSSAVEALWRRAAPLSQAASSGPESTTLLVPRELASDVRTGGGTSSPFKESDIVETRTSPFLSCLRRSGLQVFKRISP
jgi:hypothetical protein